MERLEPFTNANILEIKEAAHLLRVKKQYRKGKLASYICIAAIYFLAAVTAYSNISSDNPIILTVLAVIVVGFIVDILILLIFWLDARGYDISDDELALHELAMAAREYHQHPDETDSWLDHLKNAKYLLVNHSAGLFSRFRKQAVVDYIRYLESKDTNLQQDTHFEEFYEEILLHLHNERHAEIDDEIRGLVEDVNTNRKAIYGMETVLSSINNLIIRWNVRSFLPIIATLAFGVSVYIWYDEQMGSFITIALLTAIGILRSRSD